MRATKTPVAEPDLYSNNSGIAMTPDGARLNTLGQTRIQEYLDWADATNPVTSTEWARAGHQLHSEIRDAYARIGINIE